MKVNKVEKNKKGIFSSIINKLIERDCKKKTTDFGEIKDEKLSKQSKKSDMIDTENLYVGNLSWLSSELDSNFNGPKVKTTEIKYIFLKNEDDSFAEVFTGFETTIDDDNSDVNFGYFDDPKIINLDKLSDVTPRLSSKVHKYSLLMILEEVNKKQIVKDKEYNVKRLDFKSYEFNKYNSNFIRR